MALVNNPNVYTGGNVVFDNSRGLDLMAKLQAQERAKLDAVDEYVRGLNTKITPKGMRRVDEPVFNEKYKAWVELGKDRKKLLDPNVRAQFDIAGQELLNFVEESKATEERKKPFVELLIDPNKAKQLRPEVFGMVQKHDQPLYIKDEQGNFVKNPQRADIDYTSKLFKAPEFDFNKKIGEWSKGISAGEVPEFDKGVVNSQTAEIYYPVKEKFSKDQAIQIGLNAGRGVADDEDALMYYNDRLRTLPKSEYDRLNKIFQDKFGETREVKLPNGQVVKERNYITDTRPETLAMAEAADWAERFVGKESMKAKSDFERKQQAQLNKIYIQDSLVRGRKGAGSGEYNLADYDVFKRYEDKYTTKEVEVKEKSPSGWGTVSVKKNITIVPENEVDVNDKKLIGETRPYKDEKGIRYYIVRDDGDWEGYGGQVISRANAARKNMDATTLSEEKRGKLSETIVPKPPTQKPQPKPKPKDPLGLGL